MNKANSKTNAVNATIHGIQCDAAGCDYRDDAVDQHQLESYRNMPCPKCGANLLTDKDWETLQAMLKIVELVNTLAGPQKEDSERACYRVNMDGTGSIKSFVRKD